jgi:type III restriction enzyme
VGAEHSRTGFGVPLISLETTNTFYPDFVARAGSNVFAIDTKGRHLLPKDASRKLPCIAYPDGLERKLRIRFVSEGRWNQSVELEEKDSYTVWGVHHDGTHQATYLDQLDAVVEAILKVVKAQ